MAGVSSETKSPSVTPRCHSELCSTAGFAVCLHRAAAIPMIPPSPAVISSQHLAGLSCWRLGQWGHEEGEVMPQGRRGCSALMSNLRHPELFPVPAANPGAAGDRHTLLSVSLWAGKPQVQQRSGRNSSLQCPCPETGTRDMCQEKRGRNPIKKSDFWTKGVLCSCHVLTGMGLHSSPPRAWFVGAGGHSGSWPGTHHISISQTIFKSR